MGKIPISYAIKISGGMNVMRVKKLGASLLLSAVVLLIPLSSAFAEAGWQYYGLDTFHKNSAGNYVSDVYTSDGGEIRICAATYKTISYKAYEYDPDNADDYVGSYTLSNGQCHDFYVEGFRDGSNNAPEIYFSVGSYSLAGGKIWD
jgi:hypothetical protein